MPFPSQQPLAIQRKVLSMFFSNKLKHTYLIKQRYTSPNMHCDLKELKFFPQHPDPKDALS